MAESGSIVSGVAGRYASALFELASETRAIDAVSKDLARFEAMIEGSADLARLVKSPVFTAEEQEKAIAALLAKAKITGLAANFLRVVASKRRLFAVPGMIAAYRTLAARAAGVTRAEVTLAEAVNDARMNEIRTAISQSAGGPVEMSVKIDPAIIGGMVVKIGSRMIDASLRTKLNSIRIRMKEVG